MVRSRFKYRCSKCEQLGHNARTCEQLAPHQRKVLQMLAGYEDGTAAVPKNLQHWERVAQGRAAVLAMLERALGSLSKNAPSYHYIMAAITRLEEIR